MSVRIFTVDEANQVLPEVESAVRAIRETARQLTAAQDRYSVLSLLGAESPTSPEHREIVELGLEMEKRVGEYNTILEGLQSIGAVLKDLQHGLVDFYARRGGRLVFLCWRLGEASVSHWHEIAGGFGGRKPIEPTQDWAAGAGSAPLVERETDEAVGPGEEGGGDPEGDDDEHP